MYSSDIFQVKQLVPVISRGSISVKSVWTTCSRNFGVSFDCSPRHCWSRAINRWGKALKSTSSPCCVFKLQKALIRSKKIDVWMQVAAKTSADKLIFECWKYRLLRHLRTKIAESFLSAAILVWFHSCKFIFSNL